VVWPILLLGLSLGQDAPPPPPPPVTCAQLQARASNPAVTFVCLGEQMLREAEKTPKDDPERDRRFTAAADQYRRAANAASDPEIQTHAFETLAKIYDPDRLNEPAQVEMALRELVRLAPTELAPLFRLARFQEAQGQIDAAEQTFLDARRQRPDQIEPYRELAQFYARRAVAVQQAEMRARGVEPRVPGQPDSQGVYSIGGPVPPPAKVDNVNPAYPYEAQVAGINGVVIMEIVVNEAGQVADARMLRGLPILEQAAFDAVRQWRFKPTVIDGRPVPVRMTVTVNFSLKK
jgi:protein TonB